MFSSGVNKALKKHSGSNGIRTHGLYDTSAVLYQLSYQTYEWLLLQSESKDVELQLQQSYYMSSCCWQNRFNISRGVFQEAVLINTVSYLLSLLPWGPRRPILTRATLLNKTETCFFSINSINVCCMTLIAAMSIFWVESGCPLFLYIWNITLSLAIRESLTAFSSHLLPWRNLPSSSFINIIPDKFSFLSNISRVSASLCLEWNICNYPYL